MNFYEVDFFAVCPNNNLRISYTLVIKIHSVIPVESIVSYVQSVGVGFHEKIADTLAVEFGGLQTLTAMHHGVKITTHRSGPAREFNCY